MRALRQHLPLLGCLTVAALSLFIPLRGQGTPQPTPTVPEDPPPTVPSTQANPDPQAAFQLGNAARGRVGLAQGRVAAGVDNVVPLALELTGLSADANLPRTLVLCVDRSGSMSGAPIRHARTAARALIERLQPQDEVALVSFSGDAGVDLMVTPATPEGLQAALEAVDRLAARGGTNLAEGLSLAMAQARVGHGAIKRVVLVSDGIPTEGDTRPSAIVSVASLAARGGISITALGVGAQAPGGLMERVAVAGVGNFRFVRDSSSLSQALAMELHDTASVALRAVQVAITLPSGASVVKSQGMAVEQSGNQATLTLGDLTTGETRHALMHVRLPAATEGAFDFSARIQGLRAGAPLHAVAQLGAVPDNDAAAVARSHVAWVGSQVYLADASMELKQAAEVMDKGDVAGGRAQLNKVAEKLEQRARADRTFAPAAAKLRSLADEASAAPVAGMASNAAHEGAYGLVR